jgi:pyridoxamine 5'-phosphate oxidase
VPDEDDPLEAESLPTEPFAIVRRWLDEAEAAGIRNANAIALATADAEGRPSVRHVLLRRVDHDGFVFFTNHGSRKGRELDANPRAAFATYWRELDRQVTATGDVDRLAETDADAYFATRPREAQLGAWASRQSEELGSRAELLDRYASVEDRFAGGEVPRPPFWGGYRLRPVTVELWIGRAHRLHDRFRYARTGSGWSVRRLSP